MVSDVSAGSSDQSGSFLTTASSTSGVVDPTNALLPASISYSTAPKEKISLRRSTGRPTACSGDMYAAVPRIMPARVCPMVMVGEFASEDLGGSSSRTLARPKSSTFTTPSGVILMLAGFRSRCMMLRSCANSNASTICFAIATASSSASGPSLMRSASVGPSTSARTNPK